MARILTGFFVQQPRPWPAALSPRMLWRPLARRWQRQREMRWARVIVELDHPGVIADADRARGYR